ncbi:MAG: glycosyltransferase family 39 protein [Candidatus Omnitrophica bacterium]|jgi:4-amino-4-deoxy-L-arabinose transferase-like glycosyltransferase|nr:glycosyltransferase family 39 protein [Candidatus Omnitrophota bacterium]
MEKKYFKFNIFTLVFLLVLFAGVSFVSASLKSVKFASGADEGYYLKYATYLGEYGLGGLKEIFQNYLANQNDWLFPNPLRIGFIIISGFWLKLFGYSFINLAYLSLMFYVLTLLTGFYYCRKFFGQISGLLFTLLLAFSPLHLAMARRALVESAVAFFSLFLFWSFWDYLQDKSKKKLILFIFIFAFSILVKETFILFSLFFIIYLAYKNYILKEKVYLKEYCFVIFAPLFISGLIYLSLGCAGYLLSTVKIILNSPANNLYALNFGSGPWFRYLIDYMLLSPFVLILAIGFIAANFFETKNNRIAVYFSLVIILGLFFFNFFTKNVRYVIFLDAPIRLLAVLALGKITQRVFPLRANVWIFAIVICLSFFDCLNFQRFFIFYNIYDPVSFLLLQASHIIPF